MKALQISEYGTLDVLSLNQNAPKPVPEKAQMLVEVHAASIHPIDWRARTAKLKIVGGIAARLHE